MKQFALALIAASVSAETLVFEDNFDEFDLKTWKHEITMGGGGNWEFEMYMNTRDNSFVEDGVLYMQPTLSADRIGEDTVRTGSFSMWGGEPADYCTSNAFYGCERNAGASGNYINPVISSRVRTTDSFSFTYGRVEVVAQLPKGDWIWPAIWLLPRDQQYGTWPTSGEIDIMESRGNDPSCSVGGSNAFGSTLHWGPAWNQNGYEKTTQQYLHSESLGNGMHTYGLEWTEEGLFTYIDDPANKVLEVDFTEESFWERGGFTGNNPWRGQPNAAPFNKDFYLILNVAVGGTNGYFPDGQCGKPWSNTSPTSVNEFYNAKDQWYSTWNYPASNDSAMKIDSVRVWQFDAADLAARSNQSQFL